MACGVVRHLSQDGRGDRAPTVWRHGWGGTGQADDAADHNLSVSPTRIVLDETPRASLPPSGTTQIPVRAECRTFASSSHPLYPAPTCEGHYSMDSGALRGAPSYSRTFLHASAYSPKSSVISRNCSSAACKSSTISAARMPGSGRSAVSSSDSSRSQKISRLTLSRAISSS